MSSGYIQAAELGSLVLGTIKELLLSSVPLEALNTIVVPAGKMFPGKSNGKSKLLIALLPENTVKLLSLIAIRSVLGSLTN